MTASVTGGGCFLPPLGWNGLVLISHKKLGSKRPHQMSPWTVSVANHYPMILSSFQHAEPIQFWFRFFVANKRESSLFFSWVSNWFHALYDCSSISVYIYIAIKKKTSILSLYQKHPVTCLLWRHAGHLIHTSEMVHMLRAVKMGHFFCDSKGSIRLCCQAPTSLWVCNCKRVKMVEVKYLNIWVFPKIMGIPKSSILIGFSIINHPFRGTTSFGNIQIYFCLPPSKHLKTPSCCISPLNQPPKKRQKRCGVRGCCCLRHSVGGTFVLGDVDVDGFFGNLQMNLGGS